MTFRRRGRLSCEIHIPISPTPAFFTKVHYLAASVRTFGGSLADSRIVVTVGGAEPHDDLAARLPWSRRYGIDWRWVDPARFETHSYYATALERFVYEFRAPYVLFLDADLLFTAPVAAAELPSAEGIAGLTAHVTPFGTLGFNAQGETVVQDPDPDEVPARPRPLEMWRKLFATAGLGDPPLVCAHSGWGVMDWDIGGRYCPPYFNLGVLFASRGAAAAIGLRIYSELENVLRVTDSGFRCQLALTLAILRASIPWSELPLRLNFPNDARFCRAFPSEARAAQIVHYMRQGEVEREADFETVDAVGALLARPVSNSANRLLLDRLAELHPRVAAESRDR